MFNILVTIAAINKPSVIELCINDFWGIENGAKRVYFLYEYYLQCDSVRIITKYTMDKTVELCAFLIEPIEKENYMITKPERRLKFLKKSY